MLPRGTRSQAVGFSPPACRWPSAASCRRLARCGGVLEGYCRGARSSVTGLLRCRWPSTATVVVWPAVAACWSTPARAPVLMGFSSRVPLAVSREPLSFGLWRRAGGHRPRAVPRWASAAACIGPQPRAVVVRPAVARAGGQLPAQRGPQRWASARRDAVSRLPAHASPALEWRPKGRGWFPPFAVSQPLLVSSPRRWGRGGRGVRSRQPFRCRPSPDQAASCPCANRRTRPSR